MKINKIITETITTYDVEFERYNYIVTIYKSKGDTSYSIKSEVDDVVDDVLALRIIKELGRVID